MKTLVLIDANALIHRAFYALPPMSDKNGHPTNALYGLSSILLKIVRELKPDYAVAAFDLAAPTFRHKEYEAYKAQRKKASPELISQIKEAPKIFEAFGIKVLSKEGYEADDVIATCVEEFKKEPDLKIIIITGDLDTLQLVSGEKVVVSTMKKGIGETVVYDEREVKARFDLSPEQMPDFKGLKGDPSDNIPGVPGIGEKTAIQLLRQFHTLENLFEKIEADKTLVNEKTYVKLVENKDQAFFSKYLAVTKRDLPLGVVLSDLSFSLSEDVLRGVFEERNFRSLVVRLMEKEGEAGKEEKEKEIEQGEKRMDCETFLKMPGKEFFLFLEGDDLWIANRSSSCIVTPLQAGLLERFYKNDGYYIGHDIKALLRWHKRHGVLPPFFSFDTMIGAWLLDPERRDYNIAAVIERIFKKEKNEDLLFPLYEWIKKKIDQYELQYVYSNIELPLTPILSEMEMRGIGVDVDSLVSLGEKTNVALKELEEEIHKETGSSFNINSPKQLSEVLFTLLKLPTKGIRKTPQGALSTDASELAKLRDKHPAIDLILRYRELNKLKTTYIDALPKFVEESTRRLHTTFHQTGTATGRLSSSEPNLQNIPAQGDEARMIRDAFIPEKGFQFVAFDYSQLELRIVAALSKDEKMVNAFLEGKDIHALTAAEVNNISLDDVTPELRRHAKTLNFGMVYGMGARAFAESSGLSFADAKRFIQEYFSDFKGIKTYQDSIISFAKTYGYVKTETGRRRYLSDIVSGNPKFQSQAERAAINMPVQGLAADIMKLAMIHVNAWIREKKLEDDVRLLLSIHDELVFEIAEGVENNVIQKIREIMEHALSLSNVKGLNLSVPLVVDMKAGNSWGNMKKM